MKVPSNYIQVDNHLQNLRREASNDAINSFKYKLENRWVHTLNSSEFDKMYENCVRKACQQFKDGCDRYVENCPGNEAEVLRNKLEHLRKLRDDMLDFMDAMEKVNELKRDANFERFLI